MATAPASDGDATADAEPESKKQKSKLSGAVPRDYLVVTTWAAAAAHGRKQAEGLRVALFPKQEGGIWGRSAITNDASRFACFSGSMPTNKNTHAGHVRSEREACVVIYL
jgi:hypothetical protein